MLQNIWYKETSKIEKKKKELALKDIEISLS